MKPFRKNVAIAIDGGGIRGIIPARALSMLEQKVGRSSHDIFRLVAGTSTGSLIAAGIATGLGAEKIHQQYVTLGQDVFRPSLQTFLWPLFNHRYPVKPLEEILSQAFGKRTLQDFWEAQPQTDMVITIFDVVENRTRFLKPWKTEYRNWPLVKAVLASSAAPTYFPSVDGRFVDGGVGSYGNPAYLAAFEILYFLGREDQGAERWRPEETTLISLGTGRDPNQIKRGDIDRYFPIQWINPLLDAFLRSADDQQVFLVKTFFEQLDFRRFQVDLKTVIGLDDASMIPDLNKYGEELGRMLLDDDLDRAQSIIPAQMPRQRKSSKG